MYWLNTVAIFITIISENDANRARRIATFPSNCKKNKPRRFYCICWIWQSHCKDKSWQSRKKNSRGFPVDTVVIMISWGKNIRVNWSKGEGKVGSSQSYCQYSNRFSFISFISFHFLDNSCTLKNNHKQGYMSLSVRVNLKNNYLLMNLVRLLISS